MRRSALILSLTLSAAPALAGSVVATPALRPPSGGTVRCVVANSSDTKTLGVEYALYDFNGNAVFGPATTFLAPHQNVRNGFPTPTTSSMCVARVVSGGRKNLRLSLYAEDSSGNVVAAVNGN